MAGAIIGLAALADVRAVLPGRVLTPDDAGYDAARAGFSLTDRPPNRTIPPAPIADRHEDEEERAAAADER